MHLIVPTLQKGTALPQQAEVNASDNYQLIVGTFSPRVVDVIVHEQCDPIR